MAEQAVYNTIRSNYDMMRTTQADYRHGRAPIRIAADEWQRTWQAIHEGRGTVLVGPHMGNFDMAMQWIASQGVKIHALGLARPNLGTRTVNRLRMHRGIEIMPINVQSLRQAIEHLKHGKVVITGVDRPTSPDGELFEFFGAPAPMPDGPVRLALQTNSRIIAACCIQEPDGAYRIRMAPPLEMERTGNRSNDIHHNEQRLLAIIEEMIRLAPEQWLMFVPVWPETQPNQA
jgi:lauroyl/myristoyl acyltransferase